MAWQETSAPGMGVYGCMCPHYTPRLCGHRHGCDTQCRSHSVLWVGRGLKDHLLPIPLPWAGTLSTRPACSEQSGTALSTSRDGHPELLWAT